MHESPNVSLALSNQPDNVLLVREVLSAVAETVGVQAPELHDIRTAVTEACNNVVLHAYGGEEGPLAVEVFLAAQTIEVAVRDHGAGIRPHIRSGQETALGIGLPIIKALSPRVQFSDVAGGGTEVRMEFATPAAHALATPPGRLRGADLDRAQLAVTSGLAIAPAALARNVLPRAICVFAARAHFTTDRISEAQTVAGALVTESAEALSSDQISLTVSVRPRTLELLIGPLASGQAERLIGHTRTDGVAAAIDQLAGEHSITVGEIGETLMLRLRDER
jgi:anti-sigma regulatory factor (Ser/Thr protein kinase)